MSQVHGNPDEMRVFVNKLNEFAAILSNLKTKTKSDLNQLNQSWRDRENQKFYERLSNDLKPIDNLIRTAEEYRNFLNKKAQTLDNYLNTKL